MPTVSVPLRFTAPAPAALKWAVAKAPLGVWLRFQSLASFQEAVASPFVQVELMVVMMVRFSRLPLLAVPKIYPDPATGFSTERLFAPATDVPAGNCASV